MIRTHRSALWLCLVGMLMVAGRSEAQTFHVQCPLTTTTHPNGAGADGSNIKCQQISGGDGYATMGDGQQIYMFGFGPLSGLVDIYNGKPGTQVAPTFDQPSPDSSGTPSSLVGWPNASTTFNGAIGLTNDTSVDNWAEGTVYLVGQYVRNGGNLYRAIVAGTSAVSTAKVTAMGPTASAAGQTSQDGTVTWAWDSSLLDGHIDPRAVMDVGVMNASQPGPLIAIDEDDELFLTLTNVGMIMRPDLFEQHTIHFHGYPNAASFYDGVPDASIAVSIGSSFSYYYLAPDAGTYFWHCHISPPEHLQMGMVGQLFVRPRQNRVGQPNNAQSVYAALAAQEPAPINASLATTPAASPANYKAPLSITDPAFCGSKPQIANNAPTACAVAYWAQFDNLRKRCGGDIICGTPIPATASKETNDGSKTYAYNDGDGSTRYDVDYTFQMMGFDPNFHFVGMTFNPESFVDMKDKYFLINGRSYPDTVNPAPMQTQSSDGTLHASQPIPSVINIPYNGRALLRLSNLSVTEYHTLATMGVPMTVIAWNARLLRDLGGNNMAYQTNSLTLGGGESADAILDASGMAPGKYFLYTPNLDELSNDAENFGGMMTEVNVCQPNAFSLSTKTCT